MSGVTFADVSKVYPDGTEAVSGLDLDVWDGEFMVLVGPSGCGKTTALRMVAGLEEISFGELRIGDRVVNHVAPRDRDIAMVFQSYALYPHLSVFENIAFSLRMRGAPKSEVDSKVRETAHTLGLDELLDRKPRALSGGQRQRVAMGRAIVREPAAFLMDEPLSNLDAKLRVQTRAEISALQDRLGTTTIYVTHDQVEAMTMGDRVAVMRKGQLQQVDEPQTLYDRPVNAFVGGFIGSPAMNMLEVTLRDESGGLVAQLGDDRIAVGPETLETRPALRSYVGRPVIMGIRPEDMEDSALASGEPGSQRVHGVMRLRESLGSQVMAHISVAATPAATEISREIATDSDGQETARLLGGEGTLITAAFGARSKVKEGEQVEAVVDTRNLHFFDAESGLGIYEQTTNGSGGTP